ncbi:MAG TPA: hypothetical protein VFE50_18495 [Cyclobacteriaceae bacterium]|nr:hypothetical protein [Cyclobacteriaceae bacterium]
MNIRVIFFLLFLCSCADKTAKFTTPQPSWLKDKKVIPGKFRGTFENKEDSATLTIDRNVIIRSKHNVFAGKVSDLDSADRVRIHGDTTFVERDGSTPVNITVKSGDFFADWDEQDTLFCLGCGDKIKRLKKVYYLNHRLTDSSWRVTTMLRNKRGLVMARISLENDLPALRKLTNTPDSVYIFSPTKEQMQQFIKTGFSDKEQFIKLSKKP